MLDVLEIALTNQKVKRSLDISGHVKEQQAGLVAKPAAAPVKFISHKQGKVVKKK
jgi:hypothetical protein